MKSITKIEATKEIGSKKKLRVAAYARVSTGYDDQLVSLETQKNHYKGYILTRPDWEYAGLYYDEGVSGTSVSKREGLQRLLADCDKGLIDYIIVKSISRFSRNTLESIEMVRSLSEKGIYIYFEKENIDTGKMEGELLLSILSSLAEHESRSISGNSKWSIQKRFRNGTYIISYPPYGYENVDGKMVINEAQAETVRWIFSSVLAGRSAGTIAKELNEKGIPTKRGGIWTGCTVANMIHNEKYTGDVTCQKTFTDDYFRRHINRGEKVRFSFEKHHEPIVSHEDYEAANAIIERNGKEKGIRKESKKYQNRYATSGKIICGECGGRWKRVKMNNGFGFACNTHRNNRDACSIKAIHEEPVKAAFATMMNKLTWGRSQILVPYAEMLRNTGSSQSRIAELNDLLEKNAERRKQITQYYARELLDPAVYTKESDILKNEEEKIVAEKIALTQHVCGNHNQQEALTRLLKYTAKGQMIKEFDDSLFTEHVDHIVVFERTEIGFAMKCGPVFRERIG